MLLAILTCCALVALQVLGVALNHGVIWHERNSPEVKRTLTNKLASNNCRISIAFSPLALNVTAAIAVRADIPAVLCDAVVLSMQALSMCYYANVVVSAILRYLYIFRHIGMLNDDFVYAFVSLVTALLSAYFAGVMAFAELHRSHMWKKCATCPAPDAAAAPKPSIFGPIGVATVLVHIALSLRIWWGKKKMANSKVGNGNNISHFSGAPIVKDSFVDLSTTVAVISVMVVGGLAVALMEMTAAGAGCSCAPTVVVFTCVFEFVVAKGAYYSKNKEMRERVLAMYHLKNKMNRGIVAL